MTAATEIGARHFALVGTPNSGKTALFNALTGSRQKVANYAGVTVERKQGLLTLPSGKQVHVLDLMRQMPASLRESLPSFDTGSTPCA